MKIKKAVLVILLIAVMAAMFPLDTDVSLAKRKMPPSKVYGLKLVKAGKKAITIKWRRARRAKKYIVYRRKGKKGRFVKRAVTRRTRFTDYRVRPGTVYRYFIRGYNGKKGKRSRIIIVKTKRKSSVYILKKWKIGGDGVKLYNPNTQGASNVTATLHKDGLLKIEGRGNTAPFYNRKFGSIGHPWEEGKINGTYCNKLIRYVYVGKNVRATNINKWFSGCNNLKKINRLPRTAKKMIFTFNKCKKLYTPPVIPKVVKDMQGSFFESGLRKPPVLPEGVKKLRLTFCGCNSITEAPKIPNSAENLECMFEYCYNLKKGADIPKGNNIKYANYMYDSCENLTGEIFIYGAIQEDADVEQFFCEAATVPGTNLKVKYSSSADADVEETVDRLIATKSPDSNIIKEMF